MAPNPNNVHATSNANETVLLQRRVHVSPAASAADCYFFFISVNRDTVKVAKIDNKTILNATGATGVVTAAFHGYSQALSAKYLANRTDEIQ